MSRAEVVIYGYNFLRDELSICIKSKIGHSDMVGKLRFTPDGNLLVSASHDDWVTVWNSQGEELHSFHAGQTPDYLITNPLLPAMVKR